MCSVSSGTLGNHEVWSHTPEGQMLNCLRQTRATQTDNPETPPTVQGLRLTTVKSAFLTAVFGPLPSPSKAPPSAPDSLGRGGKIMGLSLRQKMRLCNKFRPALCKPHTLLGGSSSDMPPHTPPSGFPALLPCVQTPRPSPSASRRHSKYSKTWCRASQGETALVYSAARDLNGLLDTAATEQPLAKHAATWHCPFHANRPGYGAGGVWLQQRRTQR